MKNKYSKTTHFGFTKVPWFLKQEKVAQIFHSVARKYDVMNDIMSFGLHHLWKDAAVNQACIKPGQKVLDLAGGTGDISFQAITKVGISGKVILCDINSSMLNIGREKITNAGYIGNIEYVQGNAESLPFETNMFDSVICSFGLRNVTDQREALRSVYRILKPGGRLVVLEFSKVIFPWLRFLYAQYSFRIVPLIGYIITGAADSYHYLVESIELHPDQEAFRIMILDAGFDKVLYKNLSFGIVALHLGIKY